MARRLKGFKGILKMKSLLSSSSTRCCSINTALLSLFLIFPSIALLFLLDYKVESVSRRATVAGHNLDPTPWHSFTPLTHSGNKYSVASTILKCSYLTTCPPSPNLSSVQRSANHSSSYCPSFFQWIHEDLAPWRRSRISLHKLLEAQRFAAFRVVIVGGRLYVDFYYACVQSRAMFTVWSFLQLIKRYRGRVPDVDLMFDCMDRPTVRRSEYKSPRWPPPPLFRYCSTKDHFDIPFPDWSFWGWPEVNLESWDKEFSSIKKVSQTLNWESKQALAYWKGNPDVQSPVRTELMKCNDSTIWSTKILRQDWAKEASAGYEQSKLANQCNHNFRPEQDEVLIMRKRKPRKKRADVNEETYEIKLLELWMGSGKPDSRTNPLFRWTMAPFHPMWVVPGLINCPYPREPRIAWRRNA